MINVTISGVSCSGKTTLASILKRYLQSRAIPVAAEADVDAVLEEQRAGFAQPVLIRTELRMRGSHSLRPPELCFCGNPRLGLDCVCDWVEDHPGETRYCCEFCGCYQASARRCSRCEVEV